MKVIIEADGGSRGNPGPAAFGSALVNAETNEVIAARGETIGIASNNVAEYRGLIGGLELALEHTPDAEVEVRMDSKLVIEQMAGRWKIKHAAMKPLALEANVLAQQLAPITWTWVPRERNKRADALANAALDGTPISEVVPVATPSAPTQRSQNPLIGWRGDAHGDPTTFIMVRHGVTDLTERKLFSGSGGTDPGLNAHGRQQAERAAAWLADRGGADAIIASPLQRTQDTAEAISRTLGLPVSLEEGFAEAAFGDWDGHSFADIMTRWPDELQAWLGSTSVAPPGGETFDEVFHRVQAARDRAFEQYAGRTVVVVSHVTPIKMMVRMALDAPMSVIHKMELAPASISTVAWWPDGVPSLRSFSVVP